MHAVTFVLHRTNFEMLKHIDQKLSKVLTDNKKSILQEELMQKTDLEKDQNLKFKFSRKNSLKPQESNVFIT